MRVLIVCNNSNTDAVEACQELESYLDTRNIEHFTCISLDLPQEPGCPLEEDFFRPVLLYPDSNHGERIDMVVVLGGDGTILRAARLVGVSGVPILGINYGHLGFLANPSEGNPVAILEAALAGHVVRENRSNLYVNLEYPLLPNAPAPANQDVRELGTTNVPTTIAETQAMAHEHHFALNELAITRGAMGRMIDLSIRVDNTHLANMRGDGLVIASATGSTAYALSAGGPLVSPTHLGMTMVPLASHSLRMRPVITAPGETITIDLLANEATRAATLFVDGSFIETKQPVARATIRPGIRPTTLLRCSPENFYSRAAKAFL